jgi:cell division septum initiation protein DivIVA
MASQQAQEILDNATIEANNVKAAAMEYTDSILANLENILNQSIEMSTRDYNTLIGNLQQVENVVAANRAELVPPAQEVYEDIENDTENSENVTQE